MGLMNSHQLLPGARRRGGIKTYVLSGLTEKPTTTVTGDTITFAGGLIELEGRNFSTAGSLNFTTDVGAINLTNGRDYLVCAVPKYVEPIDRSDAESKGVNYYVQQNQNNEALLSYYLPSSIESAVKSAGGLTALRIARAMGSATPSQITILNAYDEAAQRLTDPRFVGRLLDYVGIEYVLVGVYDQDNRSKDDATANMTEQQFLYFKSTQGDILSNRKVVGTNANAQTAYGSKLFKLKRAFGYNSLTDANADINPVELKISAGFSSPQKLDGTSASTTHVAVWEYFYPSFMPVGHEGLELGRTEFLTKENAAKLGRINPIYLNNPVEIARTMIGSGPKSAVTLYADPQPLARVNVAIDSSTSAITLTKKSDEGQFLIGFDHINDGK